MDFRGNTVANSLRHKALLWICKVEDRVMARMYKDLRRSAVCLIRILRKKRTERGIRIGNSEEDARQ